jgi:hypothetical protein
MQISLLLGALAELSTGQLIHNLSYILKYSIFLRGEAAVFLDENGTSGEFLGGYR